RGRLRGVRPRRLPGAGGRRAEDVAGRRVHDPAGDGGDVSEADAAGGGMTLAGVDAIDQALEALFDAYWSQQPHADRGDADVLAALPEAAKLQELPLDARAEAATRAVEQIARARREWVKGNVR